MALEYAASQQEEAAMATHFAGFPRECLEFYRRLERHNDKTWFEDHRSDYEQHVLAPARAFVAAMGAKLQRIAPGLHADPRVDRSIFRIYRDVRFSSDKSPFKTNLGIWLWEGTGLRMECSGFYLQIDAREAYLGTGIYMFPKRLLEAYRAAVLDAKRGPALSRAARACERVAGCSLGGRQYKRVPRGCDPGHARAEFLLHGGLYAGVNPGLPEQLFTPGAIDYCAGLYKSMLPIHRWLLELTEHAAE